MKLNVKVSIFGAFCVILTIASLMIAAVWQSGQYYRLAHNEVDGLVDSDLDHITIGAYNLIKTENEAVLEQIKYDLILARNILAESGNISFSGNVSWNIVNQFTNETKVINVPKTYVGNVWLGQNYDFKVKNPIVDRITDLAGATATIFQRINKDGDMLRVATTVSDNMGQRAIGVYIPSINPDNTQNQVISTVLRGETYYGRAYVVNEWYLTAYEPIRDISGYVTGMLYVGVRMKNIVERIRQAILDAKIGESGYVFVLIGKGENRGRYIISKDGERDGENIWDDKDSDGVYVVREIINKAISLTPGDMATVRYRWQNIGESRPRWKVARLAYYEPWDWVVGTSVYEDELQKYKKVLKDGSVNMIIAMGFFGLIALLLIAAYGVIISSRMTRPINKMTFAVGAIIDGKLDTALDIESSDEIGVLARAFNFMKDRLRITIDSLSNSEEKYRALVENINDVIFTTDVNGVFTYISPSIERFSSYSSAEIIGRNFLDFVYPDDLPAIKVHFEQILKNIGSISEIRVKEKDNEIYYLRVSLRPVYKNGEIYEVTGIFSDITERKIGEERLKFHNILLSTQLDSSIDGILVVDDAGKIINYNKRFIDIWEISQDAISSRSDELVLKTVLDKLIDPDEFITRVEFLYNHKEEKSHEEIFFKDGRVLERYSAPMIGGDGKYYGRVWYFHDVSERVKMQDALNKRIIALTEPIENMDISFSELFNIDEIQKIQDAFAEATNVASLITNPDGTPITKPSNFCRFCVDIVRKTEKGLKNCYYSDSILGKQNPDNGPIIQPCLSGGL